MAINLSENTVRDWVFRVSRKTLTNYGILNSTTGRLIGYARVSTVEQNLQLQLDALHKAGCIKIFTDKISGSTKDRPGLNDALAHLEPGDTLVVWKLDRFGRSTKMIIEGVDRLRERGVFFRSLEDGLAFDDTPSGNLMFQLIAAFAEFERRVISQRTRAGLAVANSQGRRGGRRKTSIDDLKVKGVWAHHQAGLPPGSIAALMNLSKSTVYKYIQICREHYDKQDQVKSETTLEPSP